MPRSYRLGVDVGGTFTDLALEGDDGRLHVHKVRSAPEAPAAAVRQGVVDLAARVEQLASRLRFFGHGTTVATNAIVQRRGAKTAFVTTRGFGDVLQLARQARPHLFDYRVRRAPPLVPRRHVFEVTERLAADGSVLTPLAEAELATIGQALRNRAIEAVAVGFLHAAVNDVHERRAVTLLRAALPDCFVTGSAAICPEFREYERFSTATANAFIGPAVDGYLERIDADARALGIAVPVHTATSNGGLASAATLRAAPIRLALSGPAAGVVAAARLAARHGIATLATFDVGGTSTDIAIVERGAVQLAGARELAGLPLRTPMVDMTVIGAGGGSIARVDGAGGLAVGPESAGAVPGPAAFGQGGTRPTLTDAELVLGRLDPAGLLGGRVAVDIDAAARAVGEQVGRPLGLDLEAAALGIVRVAVATMVRALRGRAVSRGVDLRRAWLCAYGGAGPLKAAELVREARMAGFIVPPEPGIFCAAALIESDIAADFTRTLLIPADTAHWPRVEAAFASLRAAADAWLEREAVPVEARAAPLVIEARFAGQGFELAIPFADGRLPTPAELEARLSDEHVAKLSFRPQGRDVELVALRIRALGRRAARLAAKAVSAGAPPGRRQVTLAGGRAPRLVHARAGLAPGTELLGPCIVAETNATTLVLEDQRLTVADDGCLLVEEASLG